MIKTAEIKDTAIAYIFLPEICIQMEFYCPPSPTRAL